MSVEELELLVWRLLPPRRAIRLGATSPRAHKLRVRSAGTMPDLAGREVIVPEGVMMC